MYYYIYDEFVSDKKYERELIAIENRLADLGIAGRVARLALFRHASSLVSDELRRGLISTVVAVGNDRTVHKVIDALSGHAVAFGVIPLGPDNMLARMLGVPIGAAAVDVLSARNLETIDTGRMNGQRFITGVRFPSRMGKLTCAGGKYTLTQTSPGTIEIRNLAGDIGAERVADPTDGMLQAVVDAHMRRFFGKEKPSRSVLDAKEFEVEYDEPVVALADGKEVQGTHFSITVEPLALKVITGKERMF